MNAYDIYNADDFKDTEGVSTQIDGKWVRCRPERYHSLVNKLKLCWLILTDKIDGLRWYKQ